ncbi:hypothetical protein KAR91_84145, partial [Candidatus Pacearchaeota archaeon]|nr:hypothetical protein [Candidatus Pacearchaeota archaeon]
MNLGSIAAATLTPVIIGYLLKSFPIDLKPEDFPSKAELNKRWGKQYKIMSFASLPVMAFGVYLTWLILVFLTKMTAVDTSDAVLAYLPNDFMQLLPAVFLGIFFTAAVMLGSERLLANKERLREFIYYQQLKSGGNSRKLLG